MGSSHGGVDEIGWRAGHAAQVERRARQADRRQATGDRLDKPTCKAPKPRSKVQGPAKGQEMEALAYHLIACRHISAISTGNIQTCCFFEPFHLEPIPAITPSCSPSVLDATARYKHRFFADPPLTSTPLRPPCTRRTRRHTSTLLLYRQSTSTIHTEPNCRR